MAKTEIEKLLDEVMNLMEKMNFSEEDSKNILEKLNYVLSIDPLNKEALLWKGLLFQSNEDYMAAIQVYEQILEIDPNNMIAKDSLKNCKEFSAWETRKRKNIEIPDFLKKDEYLDKDSAKDNILYKIPCELIFGLKIIILLVVLFVIFQTQIYSSLMTGNDKKVSQTQNFKELYINPLSEYNYLRKDEIYDLRKAYVKDSLFANENYEPNEVVFGSIVDYKPWWGEIKCQQLNYQGDYHENIEGYSKQSKQINNPNVLVGLSSPYISWDRGVGDFCTADYSDFVPVSLKYNKENNLIVAEYNVSRDFLNYYVQISNKQTNYPLQLSGLNALDFGYKYVFANDVKNIKMVYDNNITENIEEFRDYIHLGGSCKYKDGCNNISPMQNDKMFSVKDLPAEINLKLWKKYPSNKYKKADMYYRIIFKEI